MNFKSLKLKLASLTLLALTPLFIGLFTYIFPTYKQFFIEQKKNEIRSAVESFSGNLEIISSKVSQGILTKEEALKQLHEVFNHTRYNGTDYFFAFDRNGFVKAHGLVPKFVGEDWSNKEDSDGKKFVQEFISATKDKKGDFVGYKFIRTKDGEPEDKISYVEYFPEFGWIVGTGLYISEVQRLISETQGKIVIGFIVVTIVAISISLIFSLRLSKNLANIAEGLNRETVSVNSISSELKAISTSLSNSSHEQASALQETSASILETSKMIEKNSENAQKGYDLAKRSLLNVNQGKHSINEVMEAITRISESNDEVIKQIDDNNRNISNIVNVINEIGEKTKVINDIVFQTKLLSFNASVEAARSGEHGKGFAVVAEEVGNLAEISGQSAKEISEMLEESIHKVENAISNSKANIEEIMARGTKQVENGVSIARRSLDVFNEIVHDSNEVSQIIEEISSASNEQTEAVKEIKTAISELDQAAKENSLQSEKTSKTADDLQSRIDQLKDMSDKLSHTING